MSINITLFIQMAVFLALAWFTMKYVWPPIMGAMEEREKKIADGLAASDRAEQDLRLAQERAGDVIKEARVQASEILEQAHQRASQVADQAKDDAVKERERQLTAATAEIDQHASRAREELRKDVSSLAIKGAEQLLQKEIDAAAHKQLLDKLVAEL